MSHCDHRVWIELNGPELHIYNRSQLYTRLEKTFGLDAQLGAGGKASKVEEEKGGKEKQTENRMGFWQDWRDLIPVIKLDLNMVSFGFLLIFLLVRGVLDVAVCWENFESSKQLSCFIREVFSCHAVK